MMQAASKLRHDKKQKKALIERNDENKERTQRGSTVREKKTREGTRMDNNGDDTTLLGEKYRI